MDVHRLELALGERSYPILVGPGLLDGGPELAGLAAGRQVAVVSNARVDALYGDRVRRALAAASPAACITVLLEEGEQHKDWSSLNRVFDA